MEKIESYRQAIRKLLNQYASYQSPYGNVENQVIFDIERDHYQLLRLGWQGKSRVYGCSIHLDIKDEKIWIQQNLTDIDIAEELVSYGVLREDIVLGFQPPYLRQYTDYAVGSDKI